MLQHYSITFITVPPSFLSMLPVTSLPNINTIICVGAACPETLVNQWAIDHLFMNGYGPTETAIYATFKICEPHTGKPTIGTALSNVQTYVVSEFGKLVEEGQIGELYIGGAGVARGYLNRPELTAEKFIPNPFGTGRVYKTGDLVRQLENGELDYIGRIDNQVKVRGFRVELEEIEQALKQIESIKEAAVVMVDERLIAYVVGDSHSQSIWKKLKQQLPPHMVPSQIIELKTCRSHPIIKLIDKSYKCDHYPKRPPNICPRTILKIS